MTDIAKLNDLQNEAINFLLKEAFTHINAAILEKYQALVKKNNVLIGKSDFHFMSAGVIYPIQNEPTIMHSISAPALHYSLLNELAEINSMAAQADFHYIKNFFVAAITQSHNEIVLTEVLPMVLVNALKTEYSDYNFKILDRGICGALQQEPLSMTKEAIQNIKTHYKSTITMLHHLLIDQMLLQ